LVFEPFINSRHRSEVDRHVDDHLYLGFQCNLDRFWLPNAKAATEIAAREHSLESDRMSKLIDPTEASPADYPLGSPQSRAVARAWAEAKDPRSSEDVQRDEDALQLYHMTFELYGQVYPDWSAIQHRAILVRANELRLQKYGPIVPLHERPTWSQRTRASGEFESCFDREPKAGDLLRWEHVRTRRGPEMNEITFLPQIEAWERQMSDIPCPLKLVDGHLFKRTRKGDWFEELSGTWLAHWRYVESEVGDTTGDSIYGASTQLGSGLNDSGATLSILAVTFLGVIDGKHVCRPATEQELQQPETDEYFRELWYKKPTKEPPPGRVWVRDRSNGFYGPWTSQKQT
jgi:hypothetical protein